MTLAEPLIATLLGIVVVGERVKVTVLTGILLLITTMVLLAIPGRNRP